MGWNFGWLFFGAAAFILVIVNLTRVCTGKTKGWQGLLFASLSCGAASILSELPSGCRLGPVRRYGSDTGRRPDDGESLYRGAADRSGPEPACPGCGAAQRKGTAHRLTVQYGMKRKNLQKIAFSIRKSLALPGKT